MLACGGVRSVLAYVSARSVAAGAAETALAWRGCRVEMRDHMQAHLHDWLEQQLCDAFAWLDFIGRIAVVGEQDLDFPVVVGVDDADALGYTDAVFQGKARARSHDRHQ